MNHYLLLLAVCVGAALLITGAYQLAEEVIFRIERRRHRLAREKGRETHVRRDPTAR
jgi:hypothetical protein